jgi:uncharacterized protein with NAD-binding domain and iron-sulfur cluster
MSVEAPIKVAIIGGGCASMAAAFELSDAAHAGKYQITVYQQGWRLGGKGASGRGPAKRIEEHGLHLWMGFYENAFGLMRACYSELERDPRSCPITTVDDAFKPDNYCGVMDLSNDRWLPWTVQFPPVGGQPGDGLGGASWSVGEYLNRTLTLLLTLLSAIRTREEPGASASAARRPWPTGSTPDSLLELLGRLSRYGELATLTGLIHAVEVLNWIVEALPQLPRDRILQLHEKIATAAKAQLFSRTRIDDELRRLWEIVDLSLAVIRGFIRFGLLTDPRGFEAIDDYDCREWLKLNGASQQAVDSAFVRALYDLAFAYEDGDVHRPRIAAGQALRGAVRAFFTYRGAFFWKMQAGMGDVVFAPLYEVLKRRGVRFEFFHRLHNVQLAAERALEPGETSHVTALEVDVQAEVLGAEGYAPLVDVAGLPCWPSDPDFSQLVDGERLRAEGWAFESHWDARKQRRRTLLVGRDFDFVVLGVGLGAVPFICKELVERVESWGNLVKHCKSVSTQAFQVWMNVDMPNLGWHQEPINVSGFVEPFDTWADMGHLAPLEAVPEARAIAYFCSVLPDAAPGIDTTPARYPQTRYAEVRDNAVAFLSSSVVHLWPRAHGAPGQFRWEILAEPGPSSAAVGPARFDTQFWTANVNPSDRYSLSLPGTLKYRLSPLDATIDNLTVAGDWTDCGFNEGCVEAAVMSGRLAAHALSKLPRLEDIIGFDHP